MSGEIVRRLREEAPYVDVGALLLRAADALDGVVGSGVPAFLSLVGDGAGPVEVTDRVRDVLMAAGWVAPEQLERLQDQSWMEGFNAAAKDDAA